MYLPVHCLTLKLSLSGHVYLFAPQYLVKRKGLDFSACGLVDAKAAKRQRLAPPPAASAAGAADQLAPDQAAESACPVSVAMMDDFDAFNRSFVCTIHAHSDSGELDLGAPLSALLLFVPFTLLVFSNIPILDVLSRSALSCCQMLFVMRQRSMTLCAVQHILY